MREELCAIARFLRDESQPVGRYNTLHGPLTHALRRVTLQARLRMLRRILARIRTFFDAFTDVRYYTSVPSWKPWRDY